MAIFSSLFSPFGSPWGISGSRACAVTGAASGGFSGALSAATGANGARVSKAIRNPTTSAPIVQARNALRTLDDFAPGFSGGIIDMQVLTPPDTAEIRKVTAAMRHTRYTGSSTCS